MVRVVAIGLALALAMLLLAAKEATAAKYAVAQCGWYVGADASWGDTTGGVKFRPDSWCVPPAGRDPFDGVHMKSFTRDGQSTVSGTRFARWRWEAPAGTGISQVRGTWWHALHDGIEQRIGVGTWNGGFDVFAAAGATDTIPREFVAGVSPPQPALEDRLLCARAESKWCSLEPGSFAAIRALTITIQDDRPPSAAIGGEITAPGWRRGTQAVSFQGGDVGGGVRFGETTVDGARVNLTEYPCAKALIGGEWRATLMRPCGLAVSAGAAIDTSRFSDGPHTIHHCATDFAGNVACTPDQTVYVDNNPPAHPRGVVLAGGDGWRRVNDFDLSWSNPDQGVASPIGGAYWRIKGPAGFDSGVRFASGRDLNAIADRSVPLSGTYAMQVWLRDEAGNDAPGSAVEVPLRLDEVAPALAFGDPGPGGEAEQIRATAKDDLSGPAHGEIAYRRLGSEPWIELPTKFHGDGTGLAHLIANPPPNLAPGIYLFRAEVSDGAGNSATTTSRADGTQMTLHKAAPVEASARRGGATHDKTRIFARLRWHGRGGTELTVPFGAAGALGGRLLNADGAGLAGRTLRVVARPSRGAFRRRSSEMVRTGAHGGFRLPLAAGPSRRIAVSFLGAANLEPSRRAPLTLRVRAGVDLHVAPTSVQTGDVVRFSGRVRALGAPIPRRGKLVAIQYHETTTNRWRPVLVTRSDHRGRFSASYRFRYVTGTAEIRLRAMALAEDRWPYAPGGSRPVAVRVTG
jgi:hypothetical protein